jgi:hypothetical protein
MDRDKEIDLLCQGYGFNRDTGVLCGWDWAIEHKNLVPVYEVELSIGSVKQTLHTQDAGKLNQVMRIYRR